MNHLATKTSSGAEWAPWDNRPHLSTGPIRKRGPRKTLEDAEFEEMYYHEQSLVEDEGLKQLSLR
jgi:hypothetical protein